MRSCNLTTVRWLQIVLVLWTAASSSVSVSAVRSEFSFAGMLTLLDDNTGNEKSSSSSTASNETFSYAVPDATAELLTDLFLPAVTFDAVTFEIVAIRTDNDDDNKNIAVGHAAAVVHNKTTAASPLRLWAALQDTALGDWPNINLNITQRKAFIVSIRDHVVRHQLHGVHLDCAACMRTTSSSSDNDNQNHRVHKLRFLNEIIDSLHEVHKLVSVQLEIGIELPRYMYKNIDRVHLHSTATDWPHKALLNRVAAMKQDMPCSSAVDRDFGCPTDKIHVAVSATAVATVANGASRTLPVSNVWRDILAAAYLPDNSGNGRGVWNQTAAALLDKASTWGGDDAVALTSPKSVRHKVAWAKRMGLGGVYVWNLQDDLCVPDLAPAGIMLEAAAKTKFFNAEKLLQLLVVDQQQNDNDDDDLRDEL
jgi:hypothetical protein